MCLFNGIPTKAVNYDERKRDLLIETDRTYAIKTLSDLSDQLKNIQPSFALQLFSNEIEAKEKPFVTSVDRELLYCLDHAIHHQALIKIGLKELQIADLVGDDFGVAYSTMRYRASLDANYSSVWSGLSAYSSRSLRSFLVGLPSPFWR